MGLLLRVRVRGREAYRNLIKKPWVADPNILALQDRGLGFRVEGSFKFRVWDFGFRVEGVGYHSIVRFHSDLLISNSLL